MRIDQLNDLKQMPISANIGDAKIVELAQQPAKLSYNEPEFNEFDFQGFTQSGKDGQLVETDIYYPYQVS